MKSSPAMKSSTAMEQPRTMKHLRMQSDQIQRILPLMGMLLGILTFCLVYGVRILNPCYDDWLLSGGDKTQHYLGWLYYRQTPWTFPIGLLDGISCAGEISCIYLDTIPLFAVFCKLLSPILPATFQYAGLWGIFSFGMMGLFSVLLLQKCSKHPAFCLCGALCFILSPPLLIRLYGHEALAGQWIIVAAITLWAYQSRRWKHWFTPCLLWAALAAIAVLVHMYFIPMVFLVMAGALLDALLRTKAPRYALCTGTLSIASTLLTMAVLGAFVGESGYTAGGFGIYSANLLSLCSGGTLTSILKPLPVRDGQQLEGYAYLGCGILLGCILSLFVLLQKWERGGRQALYGWLRRHRCLLIGTAATALLSTIWALSNVVTFRTWVLFTVPLPQRCLQLLSIFRASGRMLWVVVYLIDWAIFYVLSKLDAKKTAVCAAAICCGVQLLDLRYYLYTQHQSYQARITYHSPLQDTAWEAITAGAREIIFLPLPPDYLKYSDLYFTMGIFAYQHDMRLSSFYAARTSYEVLATYAQEAYDALAAGHGRSDALYVFFDIADVPDDINLTVYTLDGITCARTTS